MTVAICYHYIYAYKWIEIGIFSFFPVWSLKACIASSFPKTELSALSAVSIPIRKGSENEGLSYLLMSDWLLWAKQVSLGPRKELLCKSHKEGVCRCFSSHCQVHMLHQEEEKEWRPIKQGTIVQETSECVSLEASCMLSSHTYVSVRKIFNILHDFKRSFAEFGIG